MALTGQKSLLNGKPKAEAAKQVTKSKPKADEKEQELRPANGEDAKQETAPFEQRRDLIIAELRKQAINIVNKKKAGDAAIITKLTSATTLETLLPVVEVFVDPLTAKAVTTDRDVKAYKPEYKKAKALQKEANELAVGASKFKTQLEQVTREKAIALEEAKNAKQEAEEAISRVRAEAEEAIRKATAELEEKLRQAQEELNAAQAQLKPLKAFMETYNQLKEFTQTEQAATAVVTGGDQASQSQQEQAPQKGIAQSGRRGSAVLSPTKAHQKGFPGLSIFQQHTSLRPEPVPVPRPTPPTDYTNVLNRAFEPECLPVLQHMADNISEEGMEDARADFLKRYTNMKDLTSTTNSILADMKSSFPTLSLFKGKEEKQSQSAQQELTSPALAELKTESLATTETATAVSETPAEVKVSDRARRLKLFGNQEACYRFVFQAYKNSILAGKKSADYAGQFDTLRKAAKPFGAPDTVAQTNKGKSVTDTAVKQQRAGSFSFHQQAAPGTQTVARPGVGAGFVSRRII